MTREDATNLILEAKLAKGVTFAKIAEVVKRHKVWTTAALLGQASMNQSEADLVVSYLGLPTEVSATLQECPTKGSLDQAVPVDPLIYRFQVSPLPQMVAIRCWLLANDGIKDSQSRSVAHQSQG